MRYFKVLFLYLAPFFAIKICNFLYEFLDIDKDIIFLIIIIVNIITPIYWSIKSFKFLHSPLSYVVLTLILYILQTLYVFINHIPIKYIINPAYLNNINNMTITLTKLMIGVEYIVLTVIWVGGCLLKLIVKYKNGRQTVE